jgi:hypothetical protein
MGFGHALQYLLLASRAYFVFPVVNAWLLGGQPDACPLIDTPFYRKQ